MSADPFRTQRVIRLAERVGKVLEGNSFGDGGAALGVVLGTFIAGIDSDPAAQNKGIDAIATDAKQFARELAKFKNRRAN